MFYTEEIVEEGKFNMNSAVYKNESLVVVIESRLL